MGAMTTHFDLNTSLPKHKLLFAIVLVLTGVVEPRWTLPRQLQLLQKRPEGDDGVCPPLGHQTPTNKSTIMLLPHDRNALKEVRLPEITPGSAYYLNHKNPSSCVRRPKDSHYPLHDRAICPFRYKLNVDTMRVPAAITEVECQCASVEVPPSTGGVPSPPRPLTYGCEELVFEMRVVQMRPIGCEGPPMERTQQVSLACVATLPTPKVQALGRQAVDTLLMDLLVY